ncbi:MAG: uroporphyrinogen-III synthase, partial [bacterium]
LVTRAREQAGKLSAELRALGAEVRELPTLKILSLPLNGAMRRAFAALGTVDWLVLSSANGVQHFFERLFEAGLDARALKGCRVAAVGRATAEALAAHGIKADLVPPTYDAEHLLRALVPRLARKGPRRKVLLARAAEGRGVLPEGLRARGVPCVDLSLYKGLSAGAGGPELERGLSAGVFDGVIFTSSSTVTHFKTLFSPARWRALAPKLRGLCLGPITRQAVEAAGVPVALEAPQALIPSLVASLTALDGKHISKPGVAARSGGSA